MFMPRHRNICRVLVEMRAGEDEAIIDRHALRFMYGGGIAEGDGVILFRIEGDGFSVIQCHRNAILRYRLQPPETAVHHAERRLAASQSCLTLSRTKGNL